MDLVVGEHVVLADEAALACFGEDAVFVEAAAVVADFHRDVTAAMARIQVHGARGRLAGGGHRAPGCVPSRR